MRRGQLSVSLLEAGVGVLLLLSVAGVLAVGVPDPGERAARLDGYAADTLLVLRDGEPSLSTLDETGPSELEARLDRLVPDGARYRLETPGGAVGSPVPTGIPKGRARTTTGNGTVTLWVWYG